MLLETFTGSDLRIVFDDARRALGDDVLILRSSVFREGRRSRVEVVAASQDALQALHRRLEPPPPSLPRGEGGRGKSGPFVIALVGPTGSGKTTTAAKLALHRGAFGARRVGLLTLDTYRVGALEQIQQYAEVTSLPLEVAYDARELPGILKRLEDCEVIVVDTPGRSPRSRDANSQWQQMLRAIAPDETHLVVPATLRPDAVPTLVASMAPCRATHAILSKLDELHDDRAVADIAARLDYATRWVTDGQSVPDDLRPARQRVLGALGLNTHRSAAGAAA
jgi:flagellar biosynthesis protein FlhF